MNEAHAAELATDAEARDAVWWHDPEVERTDAVPRLRAELDELVPAIGADLRDEEPVWAYYPWRRRAIRLLGPLGHRRLRLDRNRNKITSEEQDRLATRTVAVIGLSVGHSSAHLLAQEGLCGELRLADFDTIELSNLNRIPGTVFDLGLHKAVVVARRIAELDPHLPVGIEPAGVTADNLDGFLDGVDLVVEECDSLDVKVLVRQAARRRRLPVVMETSDRGLLDVERFDLEPDRAPFHGLLGDVDPADLVGLSTDDKVPHVLRILEPTRLSARMAASMVEIDESVTTWPQLGSDIALGASLVGAAVRRWGTGGELPSGRARVDLGRLLDGLEDPDVTVPDEPPALVSRSALPSDLREALTTAAGLAPSGGNTQPWRLSWDDDELVVRARPERTSAMDVDGRGTRVAAGAALANAQAVAAARSRSGEIVIAEPATTNDPGRGESELARLRLGDRLDLAWAELAPAVTARVTNRRLAPDTDVAEEEVAALAAEAEAAGARLHWIARDELGDLVDWWRAADVARYLTPDLHRELMSELRRPGGDDLSWGIDERTLELSKSDAAKLPIMRRADVMAELDAWDGGRRLGEDARDRLLGSGGLLTVLAPASTAADDVRAGVALQRVWLRAELLGLGLQPQSPVWLYARTRDELEPMVGRRTDALWADRQAFRALVAADVDEQPVLSLRVVRAARPSVISEREPVQLLQDNADAPGRSRAQSGRNA